MDFRPIRSTWYCTTIYYYTGTPENVSTGGALCEYQYLPGVVFCRWTPHSTIYMLPYIRFGFTVQFSRGSRTEAKFESLVLRLLMRTITSSEADGFTQLKNRHYRESNNSNQSELSGKPDLVCNDDDFAW
jgi:hypothetical protein